ncbi:Rv3654c family TadE-like protein [Frondihabitans cladoniiphilus]|uniref:Putative Flp pilus-assembly TadG-like N-terminal domain-containing protein n=1 Tax=Frondihabitans cladoniiphilus TaxID=715785 RepID=A0ABP8W0J3_9MICO
MSALVVGLVAVLALVAVAVAGAGGLLTERHRLAAVADASALAAADVAAGLEPGVPCAAAERLARLSDARLDACVIEGTSVTVRVLSSRGAMTVSASSTAGQPPRESSRVKDTSQK